MTLATRVGRIPDPPRGGTRSICWRCGVEFDRYRENVIAGAPCADCRRFLKADGDTTSWRARPSSSKREAP